jgi:hypothetical protein
MDRLHEEVGGRDEIRVEDEDVLALAAIEALTEGAGFEAGAVHAVDVLDVEALGPEPLDLGLGDLSGLVGGIVEDLDLEQLPWVIELADGVQKTLDDVKLIEDGELNGNPRQALEPACRYGHILAVLEE